MLEAARLSQGIFHCLANLLQTQLVALTAQLLAQLLGFELALDLLRHLRGETPDATDPQPGPAGGSGQALRTQHQEGDETHQQEFKEADVEHGVARSR